MKGLTITSSERVFGRRDFMRAGAGVAATLAIISAAPLAAFAAADALESKPARRAALQRRRRMMGYTTQYGGVYVNTADYSLATACNTVAFIPDWVNGNSNSVGEPDYNTYGSNPAVQALQTSADIGSRLHAAGAAYVYKPLGWQDNSLESYSEGFFEQYLDEVLLDYAVPGHNRFGVDISGAVPDMVIFETEASLDSSLDRDWEFVVTGLRRGGYRGLIALETAGGYPLPPWSHLVDVIAGDFYLSGGDPGTYEGYRSQWESIAEQLVAWHEQSGKYTYLSEVGWYLPSITEAHLQLCMQAFFDVLGPHEHWLGFLWWCGYQHGPSTGNPAVLASTSDYPFAPTPAIIRTWGDKYLFTS